MAGRPCNPNGDLKRLWQTLLPGTPFPQCGVPAASVEEMPSAEAAIVAPTEPAAKVMRNPLSALSAILDRAR